MYLGATGICQNLDSQPGFTQKSASQDLELKAGIPPISSSHAQYKLNHPAIKSTGPGYFVVFFQLHELVMVYQQYPIGQERTGHLVIKTAKL